MRHSLTAFWALALSCPLLASSTLAQEPPRIEGLVPVRPVDGRTETARLLVPHMVPSLDLDRESAGLPPDSRPELLTWDRVYPLALVRARGTRSAAQPTLDLKALAEESSRVGAAEFARFRQEFLSPTADAGKRLRDPSAPFLDLQRRLLAIDNARRNVAFHQNLERLVQELVQGESSGLGRIDLDRLSNGSLRARQRLASEIAQYRDRLDEFKVSLGLSPRAAVLPTRVSLAAFEAGFRKIEDWIRQPDRSLADLPRLLRRLPPTGDVLVSGRPLLQRIDEVPGSLEAVLTEVAQLAIKNMGAPENSPASREQAAERELHARRQFRHLYESHRAYDSEKHNYELVVRLADQSFERLCSPPSGNSASRSPMVLALLENADELRRSADRVVGLWTAFRADRLAFCREIGNLPYDDWNSFYGQFTTGSAPQEGAADAAANPIEPAAPPPPPPPPRTTPPPR